MRSTIHAATLWAILAPLSSRGAEYAGSTDSIWFWDRPLLMAEQSFPLVSLFTASNGFDDFFVCFDIGKYHVRIPHHRDHPWMHTPIVTVNVTAVTEEHHFAALDRHGCDTYEALHNLQLVIHTHSSIIGIEVTISMIHALVHNSTVLHTLHLLLKGTKFLKINMLHYRFCGYENIHSCGASQLHLQARSSQPGDSHTKRLSFATTVKEFQVLRPYFTYVLRCFTVRQKETMNFEILNLFSELGWDVCSFRWKDMSNSFRA